MGDVRKTDCEIVLDLLPLYHDNALREETKRFVTKHLDSCDLCRKEYETICQDDFIQEDGDAGLSKKLFDNTMRKVRHRRNLITLIIVLVFWILMCGVGNFLLEQTVVPVDDSEAHVYEIYSYQHDNYITYYVFYTIPDYIPSESRPTYEIGEDGQIQISFNIKKSFLARNGGEQNGEMWSFDTKGVKSQSGITCGNEEIKIEKIQQAPKYIENINKDENSILYTLLPEENIIILDTPGGHQIWSLSGKLLVEDY